MEEGGVVDFAEGLCVVQHRECLVSMQRLPVVLGHIASAAGHHHNAEEGRRLAREGLITGAFSTDAHFASAAGHYRQAEEGRRLLREGRITGAFSTDAQFATARGVYHAGRDAGQTFWIHRSTR